LTLPDNLVRTNPLKPAAAAQTELDGLLRSGRPRLKDAANASLRVSSRETTTRVSREHKMVENLPDALNDFYQAILGGGIAALKFNNFEDNFDSERFNYDGSDHSKELNVGERIFYFNWFHNNVMGLWSAYSALHDDKSKHLYLQLLRYRLAGHLCVRLPVEFLDPEALQKYRRAEQSSASELELGGSFGKLRHFDFDWEGRKYVVDCLGLEYYLHRKQYFLDRDGITVRPEPGDYVIDGGACLGDTAAVFSGAVAHAGKVFAFDPVLQHIEVLRFNANQFPNRNVMIVPCGLGNADVEAEPVSLSSYAPGFNTRGKTVPSRKVDSFVEEHALHRLDFLKLDVEGSEMDVLLGAGKSISRFRPKLAVSLYHKPNDIFELINYVREKYPFYQLLIGHYTIHREETVLYCRPAS